MPLERLLSKSYAAELRAQILPDRATPTPPVARSGNEGPETTHYSIVDPDGNAVAVTTTLNGGFGSAVAVAGTGFLPNKEVDGFMTSPVEADMFGMIYGDGKWH